MARVMLWHGMALQTYSLVLPLYDIFFYIQLRTSALKEGSPMRELKTAQVVTRISESDLQRIEAEANREGLNTSTFIRMTLRRALESRQHAPAVVEVA